MESQKSLLIMEIIDEIHKKEFNELTISEKIEKLEDIKDDEWKVVESRLKTMPSKMRLGILSKSYGRPELLIEVQKKKAE